MGKDEMNRKRGFKSSVYESVEVWELSRRKFIRVLSVAGVASQFSYLQSCVTRNEKVYEANAHFSAEHAQILTEVLEILFPDDGNGPGIHDINVIGHILWVQDDKTEDPSQLKYLRDGVGWTDETAVEVFGVNFTELAEAEKEKLIVVIASEKWGKDWLSMLLTYVFEALTIDSIYNVNTDEVGWKWLEHQPGEPRPNINNEYTKILDKLDG